MKPASDPALGWAASAARARARARWPVAPPDRRRDLPGPREYLALGGAVVLLSAAIVGLRGLPIAVFNPPLAVGVAATSGAVGLSLLQLGLLRFGALGSRLDLLAGLGFGTLAVANLGVRLLSAAAGGLPLELDLLLLLLMQALGAILFLAGLVAGQDQVAVDNRRKLALSLVGTVAAALVVGSVGAFAVTGYLRGALDSAARAQLAERAPVYGLLGGQAWWLLLADALLWLLFLAAAVGYMRASWSGGDSQTASTAAALLLLSFGHVHAVLFPPVDTRYVGAADLFRLGAYLTMLFSLAGPLTTEIAARATREERLRLSRELHDGLAQQLSLLHLRLSRATTPERAADARARDLEAAQRLLEAALLEARQAIAVLRTGRISWQELTGAVGSFADEFATNHDVDVEVIAEGELPPVDAGLQIEIMRVLQEAFSNALRHGRATCLSIALTGRPTGLEMAIRDNGRGFDMQRALLSGGVGLDSMIERLQRRRGCFRIDSQPGQGTTIHIWVPVASSQQLRVAAGPPPPHFQRQPA